MTIEEFKAIHKRIFAALAAFGWQEVDADGDSTSTILLFNGPESGLGAIVNSEAGTVHLNFQGQRWGRRYRREKSILTALKNFHQQ